MQITIRPPRIVESITVFAVLIFLGSVGSQAADRNVDLMRAFFISPEHQKHAHEILLKDETRLTPDCGDVNVLGVVNVFEVESVTFGDADKPPTHGAWIEVWKVDVCGAEKQRSAIFGASKGKFFGNPYVPGETKTDPLLFRDTMRMALISLQTDFMRQSESKCEKEIVLTDTILTRPYTPMETIPDDVPEGLQRAAENLKAIWEEEWHFRGCGMDSVLEVTFSVLHSGGTDYSVKAKVPQDNP